MNDNDISEDLRAQVAQALASETPVNIRGGNSKTFYGQETNGEALDVSQHSGITNYEPTELVITARAGTPLKLIEQQLASQNQMFGFEPPAFADTATIGGTIACNLSGPRRPFAGSARDFVLGSRIINGKAEQLHFGGEVMKNVAGYDVSRLMCGAMGTLGVLLEISIKVLPRPENEITLVHELTAEASQKKVHQLARQSLPFSASCFDDNTLHIRLSGTDGAVTAARKLVGGDQLAEGNDFWQRLKEQQLSFFTSDVELWRLSLASNSPILNLPGKCLYEWNGAQRWLITEETDEVIRDQVSRHGGHALCFRHNKADTPVFHPLDEGLLKIHRRLKQAFDPQSIFNPARMYRDI
jgi:glycolate oxidase FAD binding subunit